MNQAKTYFVSTLLFALVLTHQTLAPSQKLTVLNTEFTQHANTDDFDDLFALEPDTIDDARTQELVEQTPVEQKRNGDGCSPQETIDLLFAITDDKLLEVLQKDLYCHTNRINIRSLLDMPLFTTRLFNPKYSWYVSADLFWTKTNRANFTRKSNKIGSYLALNNEELFQLVPTSCKDKALAVFPPLAKGRLEERRAGTMLQAGSTWDRFTLRAMAPLYYLERNYQLSQEEKDALMVQFGDTTEDEQERFQKEHLISDKLGFGDMRLYGEFNLLKKTTCHLHIGPLVTLPTAFALVKGIMGSSFKPCCKRPSIDLRKTCDCIPSGDFTELINLGYKSLDTLSAIILEEPLGNRRHLGIGGFFDWKNNLSSFIHRPWTEHVSLRNYASLEYLVPGNETRYFINPANVADYTKRDFHDEAQAADNLNFLETELIDTIFPYDFKTRVSPGYIVWLDSQVVFQTNRIGLSTGLDFWFKSREKLSPIKSCAIPCNQFTVACARAPLAYQLKVLGSLSYTLTRPTRQWIMGLGGDRTFMSTGIGKDYTVNAFLRASF